MLSTVATAQTFYKKAICAARLAKSICAENDVSHISRVYSIEEWDGPGKESSQMIGLSTKESPSCRPWDMTTSRIVRAFPVVLFRDIITALDSDNGIMHGLRQVHKILSRRRGCDPTREGTGTAQVRPGRLLYWVVSKGGGKRAVCQSSNTTRQVVGRGRYTFGLWLMRLF